MEKPILILSARHRPIELSVLGISLLTGVFGFFRVRLPRTLEVINDILPGYAWVWHISLILGALVAIISAFMAIPDCLLWERIGLSILVTAFLAYSLSSFIFVGAGGFTGAFYLAAFGIGATFRILQLNKDIRVLKAVVRSEG